MGKKLTDTEFNRATDEAAGRVHGMDEIDGYPERGLTTILIAFETGTQHPENGAQFDAIVMLREVIESMRKDGRKVDGIAKEIGWFE